MRRCVGCDDRSGVEREGSSRTTGNGETHSVSHRNRTQGGQSVLFQTCLISGLSGQSCPAKRRMVSVRARGGVRVRRGRGYVTNGYSRIRQASVSWARTLRPWLWKYPLAAGSKQKKGALEGAFSLRRWDRQIQGEVRTLTVLRWRKVMIGLEEKGAKRNVCTT